MSANTFLHHVATHIINTYGTDLSQTAIVFPNKRASLFINRHLATIAGRPVWSPTYLTISELFRENSDLAVADPIKLVCDLWRSYTEVTGSNEPLDHFFGWGQLLLSDFDDIDKHMVEAHKIFAHLGNLHEMDTVDYLSETQREAIKKFFANFTDNHESLLRQRFMTLWSRLGLIYDNFNARLEKQQLTYEGALYRKVADKPVLNLTKEHYLFVGFNLLNEAEQTFFKRLKDMGKAQFYWDFDHYYLPLSPKHGVNHEAGHFIAQCMKSFPNELDSTSEAVYNNFTDTKAVTLVSSPTDSAQAQYASKWLSMLPASERSTTDTAIVMCDESLMPTLLHCLPQDVDDVNITIGYPLTSTPVASFISQLFTLRLQGYTPRSNTYRMRYVQTLLRHPYSTMLSEQAPALSDMIAKQHMYHPKPESLCIDQPLSLLFTPNTPLLSWLCGLLEIVAKSALAPANDPLFQETVYRAYTLVNRLRGLYDSGDLVADATTMQHLMQQLLRQTTVPFHGEPAEGLQLMGMLETRNLDFKHLLLLCANEGNLPRGIDDASFIPFTLRQAYGLTTSEHKVAIFSYYLHRLMQRADDITVVYNSSTTDGHTGEMSRFMLQLLAEGPFDIALKRLDTEDAEPESANDDGADSAKLTQAELTERLQKKFSETALSPSAINRFMRCQLQFYFNYVQGIKEPDDEEEDMSNRLFGNVFHEAARELYAGLLNSSPLITRQRLEAVLKDPHIIATCVDNAFRQEIFQQPATTGKPTMPQYNGMQLISREVIIRYMRDLIALDLTNTPFTIVGLEIDIKDHLKRDCRWQGLVGGRVDRIDLISDPASPTGQRMRIIDYKTGSRTGKPLAEVDDIFAPEQIRNHSEYYLQTFLYAELQARLTQHPVSPALLFIQHAGGQDYDPTLILGGSKVADIRLHRQRFLDNLCQVVDTMMRPEEGYKPTPDSSICNFCKYKIMCGRRTRMIQLQE